MLPANRPAPPDLDDTVIRGVLIGCAVELGAIVFGLVVTSITPAHPDGVGILAMLAFQLTILIPAIRQDFSRGFTSRPSGMIVIGAICTLAFIICGTMSFR